MLILLVITHVAVNLLILISHHITLQRFSTNLQEKESNHAFVEKALEIPCM